MNMRGKRLETEISWGKKSYARKYAKETNKYYQHANARVIKFIED